MLVLLIAQVLPELGHSTRLAVVHIAIVQARLGHAVRDHIAALAIGIETVASRHERLSDIALVDEAEAIVLEDEGGGPARQGQAVVDKLHVCRCQWTELSTGDSSKALVVL